MDEEAEKIRNPNLRDYIKGSRLIEFQKTHPSVSIILIDHERKGKSLSSTDASINATGASGILDYDIWLEREDQELDGAISSKGRIGKAVPKIAIRLNEDTLRWELVGPQKRVEFDSRKVSAAKLLAENPDGFTLDAYREKVNLSKRRTSPVLRALGFEPENQHRGPALWKPTKKWHPPVWRDDDE